MIRAFFDDSGKESDLDNRIVCIAGYIAGEGMHWDAFSQGWRHQLLRHGISWLHMKDFMLDRGEYKTLRWDWPKKKEVLDDFIAVIKVSQIVGFAVAVDADAWRKIPKELTRREGDAQQFCFIRLMAMIIERMKRVLPQDIVSMCFDCDKGFTPVRFQRFLQIRDSDPLARQYFQSFSISEPRIFTPLQAADLLAWETRKELLRRLGGYESRPEVAHILKLVPGFPPVYESEFWDEAEIEKHLIKPFKGEVNSGHDANAKDEAPQ